MIKSFKIALYFILTMLIMVGCTSTEANEPPTTVDAPTLTPKPTDTPEPTNTPEPTPTSIFEGMTQQEKDEALFDAIRDDDIQQIETLIAVGANVNQINNANGYSPLTITVLRNNAETFTILLEAGADVTIVDKAENNLLHHAAYSNSPLIAQELLKHEEIDLEHQRTRYSFTPLLVAAFEGSAEVVTLLIENGANIEAGDAWGDTPLNVAAWNGKLDTVKLLVELGAEVDATNSQGHTALSHSRSQNHEEIETFLLAEGASTSTE